jgi:hypothetical protein
LEGREKFNISRSVGFDHDGLVSGRDHEQSHAKKINAIEPRKAGGHSEYPFVNEPGKVVLEFLPTVRQPRNRENSFV